MNKASFTLIFLLISILSLNYVTAWTSYTHNWICDRAGLTDIDCAAPDTPALQAKYTDASFRNHHCTNNESDCSARKIADRYIMFSYLEAREISAHLYADSLVPVHWYSTDYDTCHKIFEDKVEEKLKEAGTVRYTLFRSTKDLSAWNITMHCQAKFGKENRTVDLYADNNYMNSAAMYVADKMNVTPTTETVKEYDLTPVVYLALAFLMIVLALFIYFGLKNNNKK
jgi:hypothetical protein